MSDALPPDGLETRARDLTDEVGRLRLEVKQLNDRTKRAEKLSQRTAFGAAVVVLLVVLVAVGSYRQIVTEDRLNQSVEQQSRVRSEVLCPVFALVVGGYAPDTRALNPDGTYPGSPRQQYIDNWQIMRHGYDVLGCTNPFVPPRTGG